MRKRKFFKGIALILMLVFLSNITFVSTGYAVELSNSPASFLDTVDEQTPANVLNPQNTRLLNFLNLDESTLTDQVYVGKNTYSSIPTIPMLDPNNSVASRVYTEQPNLPIIHKEINFPAFPNKPISPDNKEIQSDGVFMKHVIHMPKVDEKPVPYTPIDDRVLNGQNQPTNVNRPGVTRPLNENTPFSPNSLVYGNLNEITIDETDLNLVDDEAAEESLRTVINHIDSINSSVAGSVTDSMYNSVTNDMYNDVTIIDKLPSDPIDLNQTAVSGKGNVSDIVHDSFPIHNKAGKFAVGFSRKAGNSLLRFSFNNANLTMSPINPNSSLGIINKNRISYDEIYRDTDLRYTVERNHLKEELIVKKYTGQSDFFFNLGVQGAVYKQSSDSVILFSDPDSGQPLFYIPKGYAVDSNGDRCDSVGMEFTEEGLLKLSVDPRWLRNAAYPVMIDPTIYLFEATFTRSSVAYKQDGTQVASGTPRYEAGKFGQGIMVEEGTTNLLTANQSSVETSLDPGVVVDTSGTVSRDTTQAWQGSASMKVVTGTGLFDGVDIWNGGTGWTVTPGQTYTASAYIKGNSGGESVTLGFRTSDWTSIGSKTITLTTGWQRVSVTATIPAGKTGVFLIARKNNDTGVRTFYIDGIQIEQKPYETSWQIGGTARSDENLTIPSAGVLSPTEGTVEFRFKPNWPNTDTTTRVMFAVEQSSPFNSTKIFASSSVIYFRINQAAFSIPRSSLIEKDWNSFGLKWENDGSFKGYLNGIEVGSGTYSLIPVWSTPVYLGSNSTGGGNHANGTVDDLAISSIARTDADMQARGVSTNPLPVDEYTTCKLGFDGSLHAYPTINSINATFSRTSVAHKQDGTQLASGVPRYEAGKFGQGIMVEEGTTNLLTANQSSVETDLTGIGCWSQYGATLTRDTTTSWQGSASAKVVSTYTGSQLITLQFAAWGQRVPLSPNTVYSVSAKSKANVTGKTWYIKAWFYDPAGNYLNSSANGLSSLSQLNWTTLTDTFTTPANTASAYIEIQLLNASNGDTLWYDGGQVEQKAYATSWTLGGTSRSSETLTIPTAGVFSKGNWAVEMTFIPTSQQITNKYGALWDLSIDSQNMYRLAVHTTGRPYIAIFSGGIQYNTYSTSIPIMQEGIPYTIMASGNGSELTFCVNGVQYAAGKTYVEPSGTLPANMYIGSFFWGNQANGIIDDLRISNRARTATEAQTAYQSNQPLPVDASTTCKLSFDDSTGGYTLIQSGSGIEPYWNYTSTGLGGGWQAAVNTWNLNLIMSKPFFLIPGRGMPIGESITYNSNLNRWTFGNMTSLVENQDGSVTYNKSDGGSYTFTPDGSGGYTAPPGVYLTLQKNGTGDFTILDKHKNTYNYLNGKPNQFKDRNDNTTTFSYVNGRLDHVSDPSGRSLTYSYNANGQVDSISDGATPAHTYSFGYQDGYLTSVTDPDNKTYSLSYDDSGHISTFSDPLNRVTTFICTPGGQISSLRDARTNGQDVYETSFTQTLEDNNIVVKVTDPGNKASTFYHDNNTGNLTKFQDGLSNIWQYVWENNNLKQTQDAKGQTSYEYDSRGNVTIQTTTVDGNPANNIIKTMTYDDDNQLLEVVDGSGRKTSYKYSNKGNLLSTSNPELKESNGRKYDQHGNVVEYSPGVSGNHNQIQNGSMEIAGSGGNLLAAWTRVPGAATVSLEGFNSHGNSALKISSSTLTTDTFYQTVYASSSFPHYKLTLRADVKLDNVQQFSSDGGAVIRLDYGFGNYEEWYCWGSGTVPIIVTSQAPRDNVVTVQIGLRNASGTAWFDGVQLENTRNSGQGFILSSFSSVENSGFEAGGFWGYNSATTTYSTEAAWESIRSLKVNLPTNGVETFYQDVPVYGGEPLTFSGMVKTDSISGNGAYYKIDYYDASNNLIAGATVQTGYITGIQDWVRLTSMASAPANAKRARVQGILEGSGIAYFDAIKLIPRNSQKYIYDTAGNYVNTLEDASGKQNNATYDQNTGNQLTSTDALNRTTTYRYDNLNRLYQVTDPLTKNAYYDYDSVSNLVYSRDPRSASSGDNTYRSYYGPDNLNRLSNLTDPLNRNATYIYDRSGNLIQVLLPNGLEQDFTYDAANRLEKITLDGGKYFIYAYDSANEITSVTDQDNNTYSWSYDGAHRLTSSTDTFSYTLNYAWDKSNNLTFLYGSDYGSYRYNYGSNNQLLWLQLPDNSVVYYDYDENGRIFQVRYPWPNIDNKRLINYAANGWVTKIQDPSFPGHYNYNYGYYSNGTIDYYSSWAGTDYFNYDANGRLTNWYYSPRSGSDINENYSYDAAGNLLAKGSQTFTYNSANQITNTGYTYDANGNMTADGTKIYIYNALNQLTQVKRASDNAVIVTYAYNHNGLRKSKTVSGVTTTYNWDASGNLVRETTSGSSTYFYYVGGKLVGLKKNGTTYIVHDNLRGDVESITDTSGNIVAQAHYDPWGNRISSSGSLVQPMRYAGYYYDEETGLYYLKSRYYSPTLGRFLTRDAIGFIKHSDPQTLNLYSYCGNNPVSMTDPNGNWASKEEQDMAFMTWDSDDYNEMCKLGFRWWEEPENQAQIEANANNLRAKNNVPAFGSKSKSVLVQETQCWTAMLWMPDFLQKDNLKASYSHAKIVDRHSESQINRWVPMSYIRTGIREDETTSHTSWKRLVVVYIDYRRNIYYDYGPQK